MLSTYHDREIVPIGCLQDESLFRYLAIFTELMILRDLLWLALNNCHISAFTNLAINIVRCFLTKIYSFHYINISQVWGFSHCYMKICNNYTRRIFCAIFLGVSVKDRWSTCTIMMVLISVRRGRYKESGPLCSIHQTAHQNMLWLYVYELVCDILNAVDIGPKYNYSMW